MSVKICIMLHVIRRKERIIFLHRQEPSMTDTAATRVEYRTDPSQYRHWKLSFEG